MRFNGFAYGIPSNASTTVFTSAYFWSAGVPGRPEAKEEGVSMMIPEAFPVCFQTHVSFHRVWR